MFRGMSVSRWTAASRNLMTWKMGGIGISFISRTSRYRFNFIFSETRLQRSDLKKNLNSVRTSRIIWITLWACHPEVPNAHNLTKHIGSIQPTSCEWNYGEIPGITAIVVIEHGKPTNAMVKRTTPVSWEDYETNHILPVFLYPHWDEVKDFVFGS